MTTTPTTLAGTNPPTAVDNNNPPTVIPTITTTTATPTMIDGTTLPPDIYNNARPSTINANTTLHTPTGTPTTDHVSILSMLLASHPGLASAFTELINQHAESTSATPAYQHTALASVTTAAPPNEPPLHNYHPPATVLFENPPSTPSPWLTAGPRGTTLRPSSTPTTPSNLSTTDLIDTTDDDDGNELPLSQSDFLPTTPPLSSTLQIPSTETTALIDMMTNSTADSHTQTLRLTEGRVWTRPQITRRFVVLRFAIESSASYDQAPDTSNIEPVLDSIIDACQCPFPVDRIAIINFDQPVPTHRGSTYFTYAFLSPRSTNPLQTSSLPTTNIRRQLEILQGKLHLRLDGPHFFHDTPHLPPIASHLRVIIPSINDMGESLHFLLDGISVSLLLGDSGHENTLTLRYLAFQIFNAVKSLHSTLPPYDPFPPELTKKFVSRFDIGNLIGIKKIRFNKPSKPSTPSPTNTAIRPLLGITISKDSTYSELLRNAITHVCVTNAAALPIFGRPDHLCISLHALRTTQNETNTIAQQISLNHRPLHDTSQYRIIRNIRISPKIITKADLYIRRAIGLLGNCIGFFLDFTNGPIDLQLTGVFVALRETSYLSPQHVTSRIVEANHHTINLTPGPPTTITPSINSLRSPPSLLPRGRGDRRGRGDPRGRGLNSLHPPIPSSTLGSTSDSSSILFRISKTSNLTIRSPTSHKYYVIINGVGGIAVANIHSMNFDNGGIRTLINHVPFNWHQSFPTHAEAWTYFTSYFPQLRTPDDALFMNDNCPAETSNLTNPSKLFRDLSGFTTDYTANTREFFYFDHLPPNTKAKRLAASRRMFDLGLTPSDDTTFLPLPIPNTTTTTPITPNHTPTRPIGTQPPNPNANHHITPPNNNLPTTDMSITTDRSQDLLDDDDDLASQTSPDHLNMQAHTQAHTQTPNHHHHHKRTRDAASLSSTASTSYNDPSHSYVQFNTPLLSTKTNILSTLTSALINASIPPNSISTTIHFWAFPSTRIIDEKLAFVTILNPTLLQTIITIIRSTFDLSLPTPIDSIPTPPSHSDIDTTNDPDPDSQFPRNCRIISCPFYNGGTNIFSHDPTGMAVAQSHGHHLHLDLLTSLPPTTLNAIGWTRCCPTCPHIFLSPADLHAHQSNCTLHISTNTPTLDPTTLPHWTPLFSICPNSRKTELATIIKTSPEATPTSLFPLISEWFMESKPAHQPATPIEHHEL
jgi:hypothetical protein